MLWLKLVYDHIIIMNARTTDIDDVIVKSLEAARSAFIVFQTIKKMKNYYYALAMKY